MTYMYFDVLMVTKTLIKNQVILFNKKKTPDNVKKFISYCSDIDEVGFFLSIY